MSSVVDIVNLALSHLGDTATVASIDPPEGSAQAEHAARFFPFALAAMLEGHPWSFATKRAILAPLNTAPNGWAYAYGVPADALRVLGVAEATDQDATLLLESFGVGDGLYTLPDPSALPDGSVLQVVNGEWVVTS